MVRISLPTKQISYDIHIRAGVLNELGEIVMQLAPHKQCALMADSVVFDLYGKKLKENLSAAGYEVTSQTLPSGEDHKNLETVSNLYNTLLDKRFERKSPVIALGGGVAGDTVGFVASTYLRGVPFIQVPTTLLSMVDASVGGKVGVNVPQGKNLVGSFYQPHAVIIDPEVLGSLPEREFRAGLAECIKHGVLGDKELFEWTEKNLDKVLSKDTETIIPFLEKNVSLKAKVVMEDEKEQGVRALLNFGHTFAHAIEATSGYGVILHGEAVALGMIAASKLAVDIGLSETSVLDKVKDLVNRAGLPVSAKLAETEDLMSAMAHDKKVKDGKLRLVLPKQIGECIIKDDVPTQKVSDAWKEIRQ